MKLAYTASKLTVWLFYVMSDGFIQTVNSVTALVLVVLRPSPLALIAPIRIRNLCCPLVIEMDRELAFTDRLVDV